MFVITSLPKHTHHTYIDSVRRVTNRDLTICMFGKTPPYNPSQGSTHFISRGISSHRMRYRFILPSLLPRLEYVSSRPQSNGVPLERGLDCVSFLPSCLETWAWLLLGTYCQDRLFGMCARYFIFVVSDVLDTGGICLSLCPCVVCSTAADDKEGRFCGRENKFISGVICHCGYKKVNTNFQSTRGFDRFEGK